MAVILTIGSAFNQPPQDGGIGVRFKEIGQAFEHRFQCGGLCAKQGLQYSRAFKQTMQIRAQHLAPATLPSQARHDFVQR